MNASIRDSITAVTPRPMTAPPPAPAKEGKWVARKAVKLVERPIGTDMIIDLHDDGRPKAVRGRVYAWGTGVEVGRYNVSLTSCTSVTAAQEDGIRAARAIAHIHSPDDLAEIMDKLFSMGEVSK
ncbi:hypothetical protein PARHAE_03277 [Paracoccus haematequi]|uniref:Uncharacterized protein n=1 Tax=Paracoccus haematequi TaxID=2491866 RepID=A0A3S4D137_9RHOB|nr:hypothetical protein [Paracoccus haematequi]VDS10066.1 hypothetical protein PARHAE_03277 [Paracoccus haematequi]